MATGLCPIHVNGDVPSVSVDALTNPNNQPAADTGAGDTGGTDTTGQDAANPEG